MPVRKIPVLAYHSWRFECEEYAHNDHIALSEDLRLIDALGIQVVSLGTALLESRSAALRRPIVALTFDDGAKYDVEPYCNESPLITGFLPILRAHAQRRRMLRRVQPTLHATAFVIASNSAHAQMNAGLDEDFAWIDRDAWGDDWWRAAERNKLMALGNHSWDHNHPNVETVLDVPSGNFNCVDTQERADLEVGNAQRRLRNNYGISAKHFAYPWGHCSDYLHLEYFPRYASELGIEAAFTTEPEYLTAETSRWAVPRFVCGDHFKSTEELRTILEQAN